MSNKKKLIEVAFPLKQASIDSVHEKNVRHGHISTLHIWPARRPLAACRAALIATLLPDPGTPEKRQELCEKIGGKIVEKIEKKKMPNGQTVERIKEETEGGILHWKRETENAETLEWFREEILKAYGGRAPKVLDPFAGGGAIPLEAMRLGCEVTAIDINPVAWFVEKCTLEYPQKLAGKTLPLPDFILKNAGFMEDFYKAKGYGKSEIKKQLEKLGHTVDDKGLFGNENDELDIEADLTWHVLAWGQWVLEQARKELAQYYPTYADFEPVKKDHISYEKQPMKQVPLKEDGTPDIDKLNSEFTKEYLEDKRNPHWIAKPTVAYFWARTVKCKNCRAEVPLLKTRWMCKKTNKRILLTMEPKEDKTGVMFSIENDVPLKGGNAAQRREHDKRLGAGTMSRAGAKCPCCLTIMTMEDIRVEGKAGMLGSILTVVVVDTPKGKDYRLPTEHERIVADLSEDQVQATFKNIPFELPNEPSPAGGGSGAGRAFSVQGYGLMKWCDLFTLRQLTALGTFVEAIRVSRNKMDANHYPSNWIEPVGAYLTCGFDRMLDFNATTLSWISSVEAIGHTFVRYALPMTWDYSEAAPINAVRGGWEMCIGAVMESQSTLMAAGMAAPVTPKVIKQSAVQSFGVEIYDVIITDPPYYDAIPYSDLMDYFYIWQRRTLQGLSPDIDAIHVDQLSTKWNHKKNDGELIDDSSRHNNDSLKSKQIYEDGMARVFVQCATALNVEGRLVVVFANKQPDAWETLVSAIIRAGFVVDGSWPIQTEQAARMRAQSSAALASSIWLVGKKRELTARPGWDNKVLEEMQANIQEQLREFWDAGIRGPDFVWAATGPAMEAYSKHPVVKKANNPGEIMTVTEFLNNVRRIVVDFVVGRVLTGDGDDGSLAHELDGVTSYYMLHRNDFGFVDAPSGACILYAVSCGLSDNELAGTWNILAKSGSSSSTAEGEDTDPDSDAEVDDSRSGNKIKLKTWKQRKGKSMGYEAPGGKPVPIIDRVHRLMHLWKDGDVNKVDEYLDDNGLRRNELFGRVLQSLIELSEPDTDERSILESISNHSYGKGAKNGKQKVMIDSEGKSIA